MQTTLARLDPLQPAPRVSARDFTIVRPVKVASHRPTHNHQHVCISAANIDAKHGADYIAAFTDSNRATNRQPNLLADSRAEQFTHHASADKRAIRSTNAATIG